MSNFLELIGKVLDQGIEVTLSKIDGVIHASLNFQAKSEGNLVEVDGKLKLFMRYGEKHDVEDVQDLLHHFLRAYRMRDFGSDEWLAWCEREGLITKTVQTITKVSYS